MNETHNELRRRMMSVAYRMLGSVADAEDAVQDAFLCLHVAEDVTSPEGFLVKTTTRRCIDRLRAQQRREKHTGPWVPEPGNTTGSLPTEARTESLSQAFLLMLQRLTPNERAAFLLRNAFNYEFSEIAEVLGKSEVHIRQIVCRANTRLLRNTSRFEHTSREADHLAECFVAACRAGDVRQIERLFSEDVCSDGQGTVSATYRHVVRRTFRTGGMRVSCSRKRRRRSSAPTRSVIPSMSKH